MDQALIHAVGWWIALQALPGARHDDPGGYFPA